MATPKVSAFQIWIDEYGIKNLADKLEINANTVRYWRRGLHVPEAPFMREIKRLSKGKLSYDQIIDGGL